MSAITTIRPALVGKLNERQVLRLIQTHGPLSRAEVVRESGLSAPTVSKAVASLLRSGLLEEADAPELARGRPAPKLRLASESAQVLGVTIDGGHCEVVSAGLDGELHADLETTPTPESYPELLDALEAKARAVMAKPGVTTLGLGVSLPGLVDYRKGCGVLSPNVPMTNGHAPARDLARRLGVPCVLLQESHALCLAERHHGLAKGLDDFAMLDVGTGVGLGVMSGGRLLTGHSGLAGEIGHITAVADGGRPCGCGNRGCLETVASDSALAQRASEKLGRKVDVDAVLGLVQAGEVDLAAELRAAANYLAIAAAAVVNLFNPATLFIHTRLFEIDATLFESVVDRIGRRALPPSFADCRVVPARGSKRQGAVTGIIQHLTDAVATEIV
ncbi:MAG: ROK family transcriptional regulator [Gemmataceae bacterium]|nr:ROK family transcriptional regulator [Gemmataceae bacterium]